MLKNKIVYTILLLPASIILFYAGLKLSQLINDYDADPIVIIDQEDDVYLRFVYIGSSTCVFSTSKDFQNKINNLNIILRNLSYNNGIKYISTGISVDNTSSKGMSYLNNMTYFDEVISGASWYNIGMSYYIWDPNIAYPDTPQVLIFKTKYSIQSSDIKIFDINREDILINRYIGRDRIENMYKKLINKDYQDIIDIF